MIPEQTRYSIENYIKHHTPQGSFLQAVFTNDLFEAFIRADEYNRAALYDIVCFIYEFAPLECYGSPEKYNKWVL